jgi:hypothetical protein
MNSEFPLHDYAQIDDLVSLETMVTHLLSPSTSLKANIRHAAKRCRLSSILENPGLREGIENHCSALRTSLAIRGSFLHLAAQHIVVDPLCLSEAFSFDEPLMWTTSYSWALKTKVLIPAHLVFDPFPSSIYHVPSAPAAGRLGLGSGSTYSEAATRSLWQFPQLGGSDLREIEEIDYWQTMFVKSMDRLARPDLFFVNLTRHGVDWPVIRVVAGRK